MTRMSRSVLFVSLIIALLVAVVAAAMPADAAIRPFTPLQARQAIAASPCTAFRFGTQDRAFDGPHLPGKIVAARIGRHSCFDRLVLDVQGGLPGWSVAYKDRFVQDATGFTLGFHGTRVLEIVMRTNAHDINTGRVSLSRANLPPRPTFPAFRDVIFGADFEGQTQLGVGVEHLRPFRVFTLPGPRGHILWILDVKH
jgi:hypothetical protein